MKKCKTCKTEKNVIEYTRKFSGGLNYSCNSCLGIDTEQVDIISIKEDTQGFLIDENKNKHINYRVTKVKKVKHKKYRTLIKCKLCRVSKVLTKKSKVNSSIKCPRCLNKEIKSNSRTLIGKLRGTYSGQLSRSKKRGHKPPEYTLNQFIDYCLLETDYINLYKNWVKENYNSLYAPSIDRLDDSKGYYFDNIRVVPWEVNWNKATKMYLKPKK